MSTLKVGNLRCIEETDEQGADDIYLLVFIGRNTGSGSGISEVKRIGPGVHWRNLSSGSERPHDVTIDSGYDRAHLYLVAMLDEDDSCDFDEEQRRKLQNWMATVWQTFDVFGSSTKLVAPSMLFEFALAIPKLWTNDDFCGVQWLEPIRKGTGRSVRFDRDGGHYELFLKVN